MIASISRTLVIKSPLDLLKILNNNEELLNIESLNEFKIKVHEYLSGCQCITDVIESLMSIIKCDNIVFKNTLI